MLCAVPAFADDAAAPDTTGPGGARVEEEVLSQGETDRDYYQQKQEEWSQQVTSTATWMDGFFDDERYKSTSNKTYLRLRVSPIVDRHGLSFNSYVDLRLALPNSERWLLNIGGDPDKEDQFGSSPTEDRESADSSSDERNAYMGVSTFFKRTRTRNVGMGGGIKFKNQGIVPYLSLKWIELWEFKDFDIRASQRFRYYTDTGGESKTQVDVEWPIAHKFFFRTTGSALLKPDDPINNYDLDFSLYQYLTTRRAIQYKVRTGYSSSPDRSFYMDRVIYEVQYRQQWRDWFYTNLTPQIASYDSRDWKLDPGFRIDFNVVIGHHGEHEFKSYFDEKQKTNEIKAREDREKALQEGHERLMDWQRQQEKNP